MRDLHDSPHPHPHPAHSSLHPKDQIWSLGPVPVPCSPAIMIMGGSGQPQVLRLDSRLETVATPGLVRLETENKTPLAENPSICSHCSHVKALSIIRIIKRMAGAVSFPVEAGKSLEASDASSLPKNHTGKLTQEVRGGCKENRKKLCPLHMHKRQKEPRLSLKPHSCLQERGKRPGQQKASMDHSDGESAGLWHFMASLLLSPGPSWYQSRAGANGLPLSHGHT